MIINFCQTNEPLEEYIITIHIVQFCKCVCGRSSVFLQLGYVTSPACFWRLD